MLWTVVASLWCGAYACLAPSGDAFFLLRIGWWAATPWLVIATVVRGVLGLDASVTASASFGVLLGIAIAVLAVATTGNIDLAVIGLLASFGFGFIGLSVAGLTNAAFACVDYLDDKLEAKR